MTRPSDGMRAAMAAAPVGDDVYRQDPTVQELEQSVARLMGKQAGLFMPSGTQSNLCAVMTHCGRGEELLAGSSYHVCIDEAGGASVLGSVVIQPLAVNDNGGVPADAVTRAVKPDDPHCPVTRLLCLENTVAGRVLSVEEIAAPAQAARAAGLKVHLDGARIFNAAAALTVEADEFTRHADTVSVCLSKGLGAPVGSVLVGSDAEMAQAIRHRKILGGGLRQAGILAAAGLYALEHHIKDLPADHRRAKALAEQLAGLMPDALDCRPEEVDSNMIFIRIADNQRDAFYRHLAQHDILIGEQIPWARLVVHRDISDAMAEKTINVMREFRQ